MQFVLLNLIFYMHTVNLSCSFPRKYVRSWPLLYWVRLGVSFIIRRWLICNQNEPAAIGWIECRKCSSSTATAERLWLISVRCYWRQQLMNTFSFSRCCASIHLLPCCDLRATIRALRDTSHFVVMLVWCKGNQRAQLPRRNSAMMHT